MRPAFSRRLRNRVWGGMDRFRDFAQNRIDALAFTAIDIIGGIEHGHLVRAPQPGPSATTRSCRTCIAERTANSDAKISRSLSENPIVPHPFARKPLRREAKDPDLLKDESGI